MKNSYQIDPAHSSVHFSVRHLMISNVRGSFGNVTGTVVYDPDNPGATDINAVIDVATLNTSDEKRDGHLKSPDFLDSAQYPKMTFRSTKTESAGAGELKVTGNLTLHGVTKQVVLQVEGPTPETPDPWGNTRAGAAATTKISRSDFGVTANPLLETGGVVVGDDLKIELDIQMVKAKTASA